MYGEPFDIPPRTELVLIELVPGRRSLPQRLLLPARPRPHLLLPPRPRNAPDLLQPRRAPRDRKRGQLGSRNRRARPWNSATARFRPRRGNGPSCQDTARRLATNASDSVASCSQTSSDAESTASHSFCSRPWPGSNRSPLPGVDQLVDPPPVQLDHQPVLHEHREDLAVGLERRRSERAAADRRRCRRSCRPAPASSRRVTPTVRLRPSRPRRRGRRDAADVHRHRQLRLHRGRVPRCASGARDDPVREVARGLVLEDQLVAPVGQDLALDDDEPLVPLGRRRDPAASTRRASQGPRPPSARSSPIGSRRP